jgi:hypothetical protein
MKTPRESFQVSGKAAEFRRCVGNEAFEPACEYALLQLATEMPHNCHPSLPTDPYVGLDANAQMHGARRVLEILQTIADPIKPPTDEKRNTLNYG